jgi:hypothetical protein
MSDIDQAVRIFCREIDKAIAERVAERDKAMAALESGLKHERERSAWMLDRAADEHEQAIDPQADEDGNESEENALHRSTADELRRLAARIRMVGVGPSAQ